MKEPENNDYFPLSEYQQRLGRLRSEMVKAGMDAVLLSTEPNVVYCTGLLDGYWIATMHDDVQLALITADPADEPTLFVPDSLEQTAQTSCISDIRVWSQFSGGTTRGSVATVADGFADLNLTKGRVGLEIGPHDRPGMSLPFFEELRAALPAVEWVDSTEVMKQIRKIKSPREIQKFKTACDISCQAFAAGLDAIEQGMSEKELGHIIAQEMARQSPDVCVNHPWVIFVHSSGRGPAAYDGIPSGYRFQKGDTVYIDGGFVYQGYGADMIRCAVIGKPTRDQERYYYASRDANMAALRYVQPGITGAQLYQFWAETVCELGFEESLRSQQQADWDFLGHGIGLTIHELPLLNSTCQDVLEPGMVMAIEGNVFDKFPFRETTISLKNEDNVMVTEDGYEWLTPLSTELVVVE